MRDQVLTRPQIWSSWTRHRGPVTCATAIPGTRKVITSAYDGAVGLFDLESSEARLLGYHDHLVNRVTVNQTGTRAATSSSDYNIILWDLNTMRSIRTLRGHSDDVEDFAFIDHRTGASVSRDWRVLLWDLETGAIMRVLEGHQKDVLSVSYHDGKLITSGDDMTLRVWDVQTGAQLKVWGPFESETDTGAIDPLHGRAVLGCDDGHIRVFDITTGDTIGEIKAHSSGIKKVAVCPETGDIVSAAYDQKVIVWGAPDLKKRVELESRPALWERSINWSDATTVLAGTFDGTVLVWDASSGKCLKEIGDHHDIKGNACFNEASAAANGDLVAVSDDGYVRLGRLTEREACWGAKTEPATGRVLMNAVTFDERSGLVVCGAHNHTLYFFDKTGDRLIHERAIRLEEGPINSIRVAHQPGLENVAFAGCYSGAIVCASSEGKILRKFRVHKNAVKALRLHSFKPMGTSCSADGVLATWDLEGNLLHELLGHTAIIDDVDIDPTGRFIASTGRDFTLKVYEAESARMCHSISLGRRSPKGLCFFDARTVIVSNYWGELIKVTLDDGKVVHRTIAGNGISSVSRSGNNVIATSYDGAIYLIRVDDLTVVQTLREMTQRAAAKYA
jgi:toxoflavin biosynthesis protein ToxC